MDTVAKDPNTNKVFIVHGRDAAPVEELRALLYERGWEPVVLIRQVGGGRVLLEKLEENADAAFAFVLLTPDDVGRLDPAFARTEEDRKEERRARQNVIFECGYLMARLGRSRVCGIRKGDVKLPSDLDGLVTEQFTVSIREIALALLDELGAGTRTKQKVPSSRRGFVASVILLATIAIAVLLWKTETFHAIVCAFGSGDGSCPPR